MLIQKQKQQLQHLNLSQAPHYVPATIEDTSKLAQSLQSEHGFKDNLIVRKCNFSQRVQTLATQFVAPLDKGRYIIKAQISEERQVRGVATASIQSRAHNSHIACQRFLDRGNKPVPLNYEE